MGNKTRARPSRYRARRSRSCRSCSASHARIASRARAASARGTVPIEEVRALQPPPKAARKPKAAKAAKAAAKKPEAAQRTPKPRKAAKQAGGGCDACRVYDAAGALSDAVRYIDCMRGCGAAPPGPQYTDQDRAAIGLLGGARRPRAQSFYLTG